MAAPQLSEKKIIDALVEFGLTEYEAKSYVALVSRGRLNASEISQLTGIPRERAYDALSTLETKGWSELVDEHPIQYEPVRPDLALERAKNRIMLNVKQNENVALSGLLMLYNQRFQISPEYTRLIILGTSSVLSKTKEIIRVTKTELLIEALPLWVLSRVIDDLKIMTKNGVELQILICALDGSDFAVLNPLTKITEVRCERRARIHGAMIRDKEEVMQISFTPIRDGRLDGLNLLKPIEVQGFLDAFDYHWRESQKIKDVGEFKRIHQREMNFTKVISANKHNSDR